MLRCFADASMLLAISAASTLMLSLSAIASRSSWPRTSSAPDDRIFSRRSSVRPGVPRSAFMPSIWRSRRNCISTARSTSELATGIWLFLISSRSTPSRASRSIVSCSLASRSVRSAAFRPSSVSALPVSFANSSSSVGTSFARASRIVTFSFASRPRTLSSFQSSGTVISNGMSFVSIGTPVSATRMPGSGSRSASSRSTANCGWLIWCSPMLPDTDRPRMSPAAVCVRPSIGFSSVCSRTRPCSASSIALSGIASLRRSIGSSV